MRKADIKHIYITIFLLCGQFMHAQSPQDSILANWGNLDYDIPAIPAFSFLDNNPDNIIMPSAAKPFSISIGNLQKLDLNNFGIEISPLVFVPDITLSDYAKNRFLYKMRFSFGTSSISNEKMQIAEGLRFTIIDDSDLKLDSKFEKKATEILDKRLQAHNKSIDAYAISREMRPTDVMELYETDDTVREEINAITNSIYQGVSIEKYYEKRKAELWNARIWEVGLASMQESQDDNTKNMELKKIGIWTTTGFPIGKYGQWLIGANYHYQKTDSISDFQHFISAGTRLYFGQNNNRGFVQAQYEYSQLIQNFVTSAGFVMKISDGIWIQIAGNMIIDEKGLITFEPRFNIGFGNKETKVIK